VNKALNRSLLSDTFLNMTGVYREAQSQSLEQQDVASRRPMLDALTGLRALAAGWVVVDHFQFLTQSVTRWPTPVNQWMESGLLGVDVFFILSGFIIAYNYSDRLQQWDARAARSFLWLRIARIWPVHAATVLAACLIVAVAAVAHRDIAWTSAVTVPNVLGNLALLQVFPAFDAINVPSWSISVEFAAYLAFPLLAVLLPWFSTRARVFGAIAIWSAVGTVACVLWVGLDQNAWSPWIRIAAEFPIGALLAVAWKLVAGRVARAGILSWLALVGILALAALAPAGFEFLVLPLIALLVFTLASGNGSLARLLRTRFLVWGGRISYSVYMTHWFVLRLVHNVVPTAKYDALSVPVRWAVLLGSLALVVAIGAGCYHLIEEPSRVLLRRLVTRRPVREAPTISR
jgi:peptidoglycan/LPS O-acetylase OafA/YrhL